MDPRVYNAVMGFAWVLISAGAGMVYLPAGLIVAGISLVAILLLTLALERRSVFADGGITQGADSTGYEAKAR
jgi:hypothetical protein